MDAGETSTVGGAGNIDIDSNNRITFDTNFDVSQSGNNYFVVGDIRGLNTLQGGDVATFTLKHENVSSNITMIGIQLSTTIVVDDLLNLGETVYGSTSSPSDVLRSRTYDGIDTYWSSESQMSTGNATFYWVRNSISNGGNVISVSLSDTGGATALEAQTLVGGTWYQDWNSTAISDTYKSRRGYDVKHESSSGDGLVVYSNNTSNPVFRTYNHNSGWSNENNVFGSAPGGSVVTWVELVSQPGTDEIQLAYMDSASDLYTATWNGSSWGTPKLMETTLGSATVKCFAGCYESLSGDYILTWGRNSTSGVTYATRNSGNTTFSDNLTATFTSSSHPRILSLAADPASDRIAVVYRSDGNDFEAITWNGTSFVDGKQLDDNMGGNGTGDMTVGVTWLSNSSKAVAIYDNNNATGVISWATYDPSSGWSLETPVSFSSLGATESVQLSGYTDINQALALISDSNNDLWAFLYSGGGWSMTNSGVAIETDLSNLDGVPFHNVVHQKPILALANHKNGQESNIFNGASTFSNAESFAFQLRPVSGNTITINSLRFDLSSIVGIDESDINNALIRIDEDNDGTLDGSEITDVGGTFNLNINGSDGTIDFSQPFTITSDNNYFLLLDINNVASNDQLNIDLQASSITVTDATTGGILTPSTHVSGTAFPDSRQDVRIIYGTSLTPDDIPLTRIYSLLTVNYLVLSPLTMLMPRSIGLKIISLIPLMSSLQRFFQAKVLRLT